MLSLLGANHRLPIFHMAKHFIWIEERKEHINEFSIGYTINLKLNVNKPLIEQVYKCMNNTFGSITQPYIRSKLANKKKVLAL